ncbi:MAG: PD-(D/E)XK nuclease family protein [Candidatus Blackburnbacteria bacterium]|nr:PD-(D/E)XK nuclease family protein [Candidatus Blackburnbacteria bacterium]
MPLSQLPQKIQDYIVNKMSREYVPSINELHCTELVGCSRKVYLRRTQTAKPKLGIEQAFYFYRGDLFDQEWTNLFERHQVSVMHRVRDSPFLIRGRLDFIDDDGVIWEMKTTKNLYYVNQPKPEHIKQVKFYCYCFAKNRAKIMYVDFGDVRIFDLTFTDQELISNLNAFEQKALAIYNALLTGKAPVPDPQYSIAKNGKLNTWECNFCDVKEACKKIGGPFPWEKPDVVSDAAPSENATTETDVTIV